MTAHHSLMKLLALAGATILAFSSLSLTCANASPTDNSPPYAPTITGPSFAMPGKPVPVTFCAVDPDNDTLMIYVEWGGENNSDFSDWYPAPSGVPITVNHTWNYTGVFTTRAKAKDPYGAQSPWSKPYNITILPVEINISFLGRFTVTVKNIGTQNITNLTTAITFDGGILHRHHTRSATSQILLPGETQTVSMLLFGWGSFMLTVSVKANEFNEVTFTVTGKIFFFFIIIP